MGVVSKQSFQNSLITFSAFGIGGVNALFLYTKFLSDDYYGLVTYLLSTANLLMPLTAFGVQYGLVRFFSSYTTKRAKDVFLSFSLLIPLIVALPMGVFGALFYDQISSYLSIENPIVKDYTWTIYMVALATGYFELFYAWSKVHLQTVVGNLLKEGFSRVCALILLILVAFDLISQVTFVYCITGAYLLRTLLMIWYALRLYVPKFRWELPQNYKAIFQFSTYSILAGSAGAILLDIDKFMLPQKEAIELTAYYAVGVYIASVIEIPGRAMAQIVQPLTAKALNENNPNEVYALYRKTSINLFLFSGLLFILINANVSQLYELIDTAYAEGIYVVLMISFAKLTTMLLGNNGAIISNSAYYKIVLPYSIAMALCVVVLNHWLIDEYGMNGAALATLLVLLLFNNIKLWYVKRKFGFMPFTRKSLYLLFLILFFYLLFAFWNFSFHPVINILFKSILISVTYLYLAFHLRLSNEFSLLVHRSLNHLKKGG